MRDETVRQNRVVGFLFGLGIGLVIGIVFQPRADYTRASVESARPHSGAAGIPSTPED
jgi:hypothetical protein